MLDDTVRRAMRQDADMLRSTNRNGETSMSRVEAFERLFGHLPTLIAALDQAEAERDAVVAAVRTAQITHIRDTHPDRMHDPDCAGCQVLVPLSRDLPSRPDDPEEIRRLAQAATEETT